MQSIFAKGQHIVNFTALPLSYWINGVSVCRITSTGRVYIYDLSNVTLIDKPWHDSPMTIGKVQNRRYFGKVIGLT